LGMIFCIRPVFVFVFVLFSGHLLAAKLSAIKVPALDKRTYASVTLGNGLRILLISDPEAALTGAALAVEAGSDQDPDRLPGLAHLLEHMLFLGSREHPQASDFGRFVDSHGGAINGFTAAESTNFFFQIEAAALKPALKRFAGLISHPDLDRHVLAKQIDVVDAEFALHREDPNWIELSAFRQVANPEHPFSRFAVGSRAVFESVSSEKLRNALRRFHDRWYRGDRMALVVLGQSPVSVLKSMVAADFGSIRRGIGERKADLPHLLSTADLPAVLHVDSGRKDPELILSFPVPPSGHHYQTKPARYLANLITSQDKGRLSPYLKEKGWVTYLSAGQRIDSPRFATFDIHIILTDVGLRHWQSVIGVVFNYLDQVREHGITPELYQRQAENAASRFKYQNRVLPIAYTARLARSMTFFPTSEALAGPVLMTDYDHGRIRDYLDRLSPGHLMATLSRPHGHFSEKDPRSHASFSLTRIPELVLAQWLKPDGPHNFVLEPMGKPYKPQGKKVNPVRYQTAKKDRSRAGICFLVQAEC